jgi:hypothetical protein
MKEEVRGWFVAAWVGVGVLVALVLRVLPGSLVACVMLSGVGVEPPGWRAWPLADANALRCTCIRDQASYSSYPGDVSPFRLEGDFGSADPTARWVRRDRGSDVYVIASAPLAEDGSNEHYVEAFHRDATTRTVFTSRRSEAGVAAMGLAVALLLAGIGAAHLVLRRSEKRVRFVKGAYESLVSDPPAYRSPAEIRPPISVDLPYAEGVRRAKRALLASFIGVGLVFGAYSIWMLDQGIEALGRLLL